MVDETVQIDDGGREIDTSVLIANPEAKILLKGVTISRYDCVANVAFWLSPITSDP
jgi:hypothetical protein